jgi:hypothetical protein
MGMNALQMNIRKGRLIGYQVAKMSHFDRNDFSDFDLRRQRKGINEGVVADFQTKCCGKIYFIFFMPPCAITRKSKVRQITLGGGGRGLHKSEITLLDSAR